ncbi:unnamed protein product [[Candida] boidinii]|uniref:Unnamed protein product n=1 Tax=Candida boidinii TaxID=5477 RepID=A0A9W6SVJ9_CANBO|nr:hypothetical protein B5S30_g3377 [[Candida] boidinii]OWB83917.1 hypothetical protein B5S33_g2553 [[Candida] boidinii]GME67118.1 unnamed protein product [[Candida] boidinii]GMG02490.1 unnamed protein product [[Candida] boidinii]
MNIDPNFEVWSGNTNDRQFFNGHGQGQTPLQFLANSPQGLTPQGLTPQGLTPQGLTPEQLQHQNQQKLNLHNLQQQFPGVPPQQNGEQQTPFVGFGLHHDSFSIDPAFNTSPDSFNYVQQQQQQQQQYQQQRNVPANFIGHIDNNATQQQFSQVHQQQLLQNDGSNNFQPPQEDDFSGLANTVASSVNNNNKKTICPGSSTTDLSNITPLSVENLQAHHNLEDCDLMKKQIDSFTSSNQNVESTIINDNNGSNINTNINTNTNTNNLNNNKGNNTSNGDFALSPSGSSLGSSKNTTTNKTSEDLMLVDNKIIIKNENSIDNNGNNHSFGDDLDDQPQISEEELYQRRKAQNRAAQRAFRERKEGKLKELAQKLTCAETEREKLLRQLESLKKENMLLGMENVLLQKNGNAVVSVNSNNDVIMGDTGGDQKNIGSLNNELNDLSPNARSRELTELSSKLNSIHDIRNLHDPIVKDNKFQFPKTRAEFITSIIETPENHGFTKEPSSLLTGAGSKILNTKKNYSVNEKGEQVMTVSMLWDYLNEINSIDEDVDVDIIEVMNKLRGNEVCHGFGPAYPVELVNGIIRECLN